MKKYVVYYEVILELEVYHTCELVEKPSCVKNEVTEFEIPSSDGTLTVTGMMTVTESEWSTKDDAILTVKNELDYPYEWDVDHAAVRDVTVKIIDVEEEEAEEEEAVE